MPGGGAEILTEHARNEISPKKCTADEWLEVMRQGHLVGLKSSATMMYGHVESKRNIVDHFYKIVKHNMHLGTQNNNFDVFLCKFHMDIASWLYQVKEVNCDTCCIRALQ